MWGSTPHVPQTLRSANVLTNLCKKEEVRKIEKVDELIEKLSEHIIGIMDASNETTHEIAEKTEALAKLVMARASLNESPLEFSSDNLS